ncbi:MAG: phosphoribosylglycinamide formyltransferase [Bacteroidales bacterium]|nr:phosphoribosylglycinamide formyltransferase [Bacteroidales bacterium]
MLPIRLAILASGSGSNAENICNYFSQREDILISIIISNKSEAYVHERAKKMGVPSLTMSKADLSDAGKVINVLKEYQIDFIVLAGYLLRVPEGLVKAFPHRMINIHPALLPKFGGKGMYGDKVHQAVVDAGDKESGITIHYVNEDYDEGAIIFQARCPVLEGETPEAVASKVHALEYQYFPSVIADVLQKEFNINL